MKKSVIGIILGTIAGAFDGIPMILKDQSWGVILSTISMWIITGYFVSITNLKINRVLQAVIIALLIHIPSLIILGWNSPSELTSNLGMTLLMGALLGFLYNKIPV